MIDSLAFVGQQATSKAAPSQINPAGPPGAMGPAGRDGSPGPRGAPGADGRIQSFVRPDGTTTTQAQLTLDDIGALPRTGDASGTKVRLAIAAAVMRAVTDRALDHGVSPQDFGAKGDGDTDDADALELWLAAIGPNLCGVLRAGTYRFTRPLAVQLPNGTAIVGSGGRTSTLLYDGPPSSSDILTIGNGTSPITGLCLSGFRVASNATMTGGAGLRLRWVARSSLRDVIADGQDGNGKLASGFWFDGVDAVAMVQYEARAAGDAIRVNGALGGGPKADLFLLQGKIGGSGVGLHVGGAFGGLYLDQAAVISNGTNLLIDTALAAEGNRELFFGAGTAFDTATDALSASIVVNDALAANAFISFTGTWNTTGPGHGLWIKYWSNSDFVWTGGTIGAFTDGVRVDDPAARATFAGGIAVRANRAWGINPNVAGHSVTVGGVRGSGNVLGDLNPAYPAGARLTSSDVPAIVATTGLTLSNDATTPATFISIAPGSATASPVTATMALYSPLRKSVATAWSAGSGGGALDAGSLAASTWYHVFLINNPATTAVDVIVSLSATVPTLPAGFTQYKRIGAIRTDASSNVLAFKQVGSKFLWASPTTDLNGSATTSTSTVSLTVPPGLQVEALFRGTMSGANAAALRFASPDETDVAMTFPDWSLAIPANGQAAAEFRVRTDTARRINMRSQGATVNAGVRTIGWVDPR